MGAPGRRLLAPLLLVAASASAGPWNEPHPWRRSALLDGRPFEYDAESFMQRFSYRHLSQRPGPDEDGLRGTVGSLTSKQALSEIRFRKRFPFDRGGRAFHLAMERGEDFDGYYDRQLVGFSQRLDEDWQISVRGDVTGDKAESDVYFQGQWRTGPDRLVQLAAITPDAYFNDKTPQAVEYEKRPWTLFARARMPLAPALTAEISANHSPRAVVDDRRTTLLRASGESTRVATTWSWTTEHWHGRFMARGEHTERDFVFHDAGTRDHFRREAHQVGVSLTRTSHRLDPTLGVQHFYLDEEGFFGRATNSRGQIHRNEPLIHASIRVNTGDRHYLRPELLLSDPDFRQTLASSDRWRDRQVHAWRGKLSLPWRYTVNRKDGAILTISPSLELHEPGFGGGNVQLHWPL